ncbi:MAG TPA: DUF3604 domain-containing protein, partial [Spirochaetia bacterium]|nr:DUF3604 domain-containing protein [Spirochaetia bacterium]
QDGGHHFETNRKQNLILEGWKDQERLDREWAEIQRASRQMYEPGKFVTFPGYEWQGDGRQGDHNIFALQEGLPIFRVNTIEELYKRLEGHEAIAIPHHTGYRTGRRAPDWSKLREELSPFAEIFSIHGCSETDEEWIGLRHNSHMGPGQGGSTYQDALDRGLHLGAVCSTDNWGGLPGTHGRGLMAVPAEELTRESLWQAFKARRVYGVTGDRIRLLFTVNGEDMGKIIETKGKRVIKVRVTGLEALDRIELLRNGRVIATQCHQGTWDLPGPGKRSMFKIRIEAGWGPRPNEMDVDDKTWTGELRVPGSRITGFEPCWITPGQGRPVPRGDRAAFTMRSSTRTLNQRSQNATVFEFEGDISDRLSVTMNGMTETDCIANLCRASRTMWFKDECIRMVEEKADILPGSPEREDIYWSLAFKVKIHRVIPESAYTAEFSFEDDEPLAGETNYRVRVEQRNAQRAWSSPIWVKPEKRD